MTKTQWIAEAMRLADEMSVLRDAEAVIYNEGFPLDGKTVEAQAEEAKAEYEAARQALNDHLELFPDGSNFGLYASVNTSM